MEKWKNIEGYEGYQVSDQGNVKSLNYNHTGEERILRPFKDGKGYLRVVLYKNGKKKTLKVHRLVAQAFIPNPKNLPFVNHKDENPSNNCVENLEWCDAKYNINYGTRNEKCSKPVIATVIATGIKEYYPSVIEASRQLHYSDGNISQVLKGNRRTACKRTWQYA